MVATCRSPLLIALLVLAWPRLEFEARGSTRQAARQVSAGIAKHQQGDFAGAETAFAEAAKTLPDDPRIAFDQACALASQGKQAEAESRFERAKLARDPAIRARSLYNLGCLASLQAKATLGEQPEQADPAAREEGMKQVDLAVVRFRDCLAVDPHHADARHNLELLRLWVKHIREVWKERDRQRRREEMDLLAFLGMLTGEQAKLRGETRSLARAEDSPRRRQAATLLGQAQRELAEEIPTLQQKIREALSPPPADPNLAKNPPAQPASPAQPAPSAEQEQALAALAELARQAQTSMSRAAADLVSKELPAAEESQTQALLPLDEIYRAVAPFEHILQQAIQREASLITDTGAVQEAEEASLERDTFVRDLPADQRRVAGWAAVLSPKARQAAELLQAQAVAAGPPLPPATPQPNSPGAAAAAPDPVAQRKEQLAAWEKAVELAPQARAAAQDAAAALDRQAWSVAVPHEETAWKILREIAELFPKPPNQDSPQDQQPPDQGQDQQQPPPHQNPSPDSPPDGKQNDPEKSDQQPEPTPKQSGPDQRPDPARQQAESLLRMVRERERDYRDKMKKRQAVLGGVKVDKDW